MDHHRVCCREGIASGRSLLWNPWLRMPNATRVIVVIDLIFQPGAAEGEVPPAVVEREFEQVAAVEERAGGTDEQIPGVLRAEPTPRKTDSGRSHGPPPAELGVVIVRARQDEQPL